MPTITIPTVTGASAGVSAASSSAKKAASSPITIQGSATERAKEFSDYYVTINQGIVGDPEGAARSIVDVLNRSSGRGGLGAAALTL